MADGWRWLARERKADSGLALDVLIDNKMAAAAARQGIPVQPGGHRRDAD
jgi:hypothetical protein